MTWSERRYSGSSPGFPRSTTVTLGIIIACVVIWVLQSMPGPDRIFGYLALSRSGLFSGLRVWQPFTYMFLHSTDGVFHIMFNMFCLWWMAPSVESALGTRRFCHLYVWAGVTGGLAHCLA